MLLYSSSNLTIMLHHCLDRCLNLAGARSPLSMKQSNLINTGNPNYFTYSNALNCCSAGGGHVETDTVNHRLSNTEFHPQCDQNPPIAGWDRINTCRAQPMTFPLPAVRRRNSLTMTCMEFVYSPGLAPRSRRDHRNRVPLFSSPCNLFCLILKETPQASKTQEYHGAWRLIIKPPDHIGLILRHL